MKSSVSSEATLSPTLLLNPKYLVRLFFSPFLSEEGVRGARAGEVMAQTSPFLTRANDKTVGDPDAPPHPPQAPHHAFGGLHFPPDPPLKLQPNYRPPFSTGVGTDDAPAPPIHHSENSSDNVVAGEDRTDFDADHEDFDAGVRMPGLHLLAGGGIIAAAVGVAVVHRRRRSKVLAPVYEPIPNTASAVYGSMEAMQPPRL
jgi:hypothetical protein